jgi:hypothetical protein
MTHSERGTTPAHGFGESIPGNTKSSNRASQRKRSCGRRANTEWMAIPSNSLPPTHDFRVDPMLKQFLDRTETGEAGALQVLYKHPPSLFRTLWNTYLINLVVQIKVHFISIKLNLLSSHAILSGNIRNDCTCFLCVIYIHVGLSWAHDSTISYHARMGIQLFRTTLQRENKTANKYS